MGIIIYLVIVGALYFLAYRQSRLVWNLKDTPTVSPSGAIIGLCEVNGQASPGLFPSGDPFPNLSSPIMGIECIWFRVTVEYYDTLGKDSSWKDLYIYSSQGGFRIADRYGSIGVNTQNVTLRLNKSISLGQSQDVVARAKYFYDTVAGNFGNNLISYWQSTPDNYYWYHPNVGHWLPYTYVSPDRLQYYDFESSTWKSMDVAEGGFAKFIRNMTNMANDSKWKHEIRVSEEYISAGTELFAHGEIQISSDGIDLIYGKTSSKKDITIISKDPENKVISSARKSTIILTTLSIVLVTGGYIIAAGNVIDNFYHGSSQSLPIIYCVLAAIYILGGIFTYVISRLLRTYNRFVRLKQQIDLSRSALDVALRRRADLIPQLVSVLEGARDYESNTQELLARLRSDTSLDASKEFLGLAEAYPDLKASENFLFMQKELGRTEEKVAMARSFINDSILALDQLRATYTGMIFSPLFKKQDYTNV